MIRLLCGIIVSSYAQSDTFEKLIPRVSLDGRIGFFGDWDNDKLTGFATFTDHKVKVYKVDEQQKHTETEVSLSSWKASDVTDPFTIHGIIATDFNFDGKLDILVVLGNADATRFAVQLLRRLTGSFAFVHDQQKVAAADLMHTQPLLADINADGYPDLVSENGVGRTVWLNRGSSNTPDSYLALKNFQDFASGSSTLLPLANPHSSAVVDINGDCKPDLAFVVNDNGVNKVEVWLMGQTKFTQHEAILSLPANSFQVTWADFDGNGTMDMVVPVCVLKNNRCTNSSIHIFKNVQAPMCSSKFTTATETCRKSMELCTPSDFSFEQSDVPLESGYQFALDIDPASPKTSNLAKTITLRQADWDADGFPDLAAVLEKGGTRLAALLNSTLSQDGVQENQKEKPDQLNFAVMPVIEEDSKIVDTIAFFDFNDDNYVDVLGVLQTKEGTFEMVPYTQSKDSSAYRAHFHIKATALNGMCISSCTEESPWLGPNKPYGVNYPGGIFKITVTDYNSNRHPRAAAMFTQSAFTPLMIPFIYFGLGRSNNYIEELYLGTSNHAEEHSKVFISTFPNVHAIGIPYHREHPTEWSLELAISPSDYILKVALMTLAVLTFIALIIFVLDQRERIKENKQQHESFRIHFINA